MAQKRSTTILDQKIEAQRKRFNELQAAREKANQQFEKARVELALAEADMLLEFGGIQMPLNKKEFRSGKHGFGAYGKVNMGGKWYQVSCNITEITRKRK